MELAHLAMVVMAALEMQLAQNLMMVQPTILEAVPMVVHPYINLAVQLLFLALLAALQMVVMVAILIHLVARTVIMV